MTDPTMADHVYLKPLTTKSIREILEKHPNIDAVLPYHGWPNSFKTFVLKRILKEFGKISV